MRRKKPFWLRIWDAGVVVVLLPLVIPLALLAFALYLPYRASLYLLVWTVWLPKGKDILFVYSDSPYGVTT